MSSRQRHLLAELLRLVRATPEASCVAARVLDPLIRYDREHDGDLLHTLRVYFQCEGNVRRGAELLFLHRNGLIYRLGRIESLLGVSLSDPESRMGLQVALLVFDADQ